MPGPRSSVGRGRAVSTWAPRGRTVQRGRPRPRPTHRTPQAPLGGIPEHQHAASPRSDGLSGAVGHGHEKGVGLRKLPGRGLVPCAPLLLQRLQTQLGSAN